MTTRLWVAAFVTALAVPRAAAGFCGFYVAGADAELYNNATQVVLMREGTRTVLSMQNNYQGPPEAFAMVVPVPVVLQKENVKTLPREVFVHVHRLAAPRLVEYWEQDPCAVSEYAPEKSMSRRSAGPAGGRPREERDDLGVTIEAQFTVGEYEVVILSAEDALGLDTWLRRERYQIPAGAEPLLRPYVEGGAKFFVAKVDPAKVTFVNGQAMLSPLRFHYDSDELALPVRLGLINSAGTQDLIIHVLARGQRFEVANYPNVSIPTNLDVDDAVRTRFGAFYASLFDATLEKNPGAVVTEYSWDAGTCDPCPSPPLSPGEIATLGGDALPGTSGAGPGGRRGWGGGFVLTRLHARYGKDGLGQDLIFRAAEPITGGREQYVQQGQVEKGAQPSSYNNFQGRYVIRHEWTGPIACANPVRGVWGGPPGEIARDASVQPALDLAFAPRGEVELAAAVRQDVPEIGVKARGAGGRRDRAAGAGATKPPPREPARGGGGKGGGCGCSVGADGGGAAEPLSLAALLAVALLVVRRRPAE